MKFAHITCLLHLTYCCTTILALTTTMMRRHNIQALQLHQIHQIHRRSHHRHFSMALSSDSDIQTTSSTTTNNSTKINKSSSSKSYPPPPDPSTFPGWSYQPRDFFWFEIIHESTKSLARVGRIHTPHGIIDTPSYVAVATNGALKGVDFRDADAANQQLIFANTYHLLLQPGTEVVEEAGGLHNFINRRDRPLITDSG